MSDNIGTTIGAYLGYVSTVLMFSLSVFAICNHRRCRSKCFGHDETVFSIDVEATTPPDKPTIHIPAT
jgi:hypothetical protein